jgi:hypothetical protein
MYWHCKGSVTSDSAIVYLLCIQALHQWYHGYHPLKDYISGPQNTMADDESRLHTLSDPAFLNHFNSTYPQPQSWHLWRPTPQILSAMTSALRKQTSKPASFLLAPVPPTLNGISGSPSATNSEWILPYNRRRPLSFPPGRRVSLPAWHHCAPSAIRPFSHCIKGPTQRWPNVREYGVPRPTVHHPRQHRLPPTATSAYSGNLPAIPKKTLLRPRQANPHCYHRAHTHGCAPFRHNKQPCGCRYDWAGLLLFAPSGRIHRHGLRHHTLPYV